MIILNVLFHCTISCGAKLFVHWKSGGNISTGIHQEIYLTKNCLVHWNLSESISLGHSMRFYWLALLVVHPHKSGSKLQTRDLVSSVYLVKHMCFLQNNFHFNFNNIGRLFLEIKVIGDDEILKKNNSNKALLRSARILRRVLETWGDLLSLSLQWKTIS